MDKIGRNDPCPCGSGVKYKKCCIGTVLPFRANDKFNARLIELPLGATESNLVSCKNDVLELISQNKFDSLEEVNKALGILSREKNKVIIDSFLGLSLEDMNDILYQDFNLNNILFTFSNGQENELLKLPLLKKSLYLLNKLNDNGELKATKKGNLPKIFVQEMAELFFTQNKYLSMPQKEEDFHSLVCLRGLLTLSGLIKKRNNKFSLTKKGIKIIEKNKINELYQLLFTTSVNKWNWGFSDGYPDVELIQNSTIYNLFILSKKCKDWTLDQSLGEVFLNSFPALIDEIPPTHYATNEQEIINIFSIRFLERFCIPFGLLESRTERASKGSFNSKDYYRLTHFFEKCFHFKS